MSVSSIPASTDYSSSYVTSQPAATAGNLLASQLNATSATIPVSSTTLSPTISTALSSYESSYQTLLADDTAELLSGSFGSSSPLNQPSTSLGNSLITQTTNNTIDVLAQFASLQAAGYQTAQTEQTAQTTAAAQAAAQNAQDNAVLAAPIDPVDPYAAFGSADPLNLVGQNVDATA